MHNLRDTVHDDFKRNGDLLLDLFRRNTWPLGNDLDVVVGYVGISLDRQPFERNYPSSEKQQCETQHQEPVVQSEINDSTNHLLLHRVLQYQGIRNYPISGLEPGNNLL